MLDVLHPSEAGRPNSHKDKLAETKKQQAALHEAHKAQERAEREAKEKKQHDVSAAYKAIRAIQVSAEPDQKHSKRALKEQRDAIKHAEKAATAVMCEHGVNRCKICFPPKSEAAKHHDHERRGATAVRLEDEEEETNE